MLRSFKTLWDGVGQNPGLYERLVFAAESRDAPAETKRHVVVAERLQRELLQATVLDEGREPASDGYPCKLPDGSIVFNFTTLWEDMSRGADKITRGELSSVLEKVGAIWYAHKKFKRLKPASMLRLQAMIAGAGDDGAGDDEEERGKGNHA